MSKLGRQTIQYDSRPRVLGRYSVVGPKEAEGNFGRFFHKCLKDDTLGEKSYEMAESRLLLMTIENAIEDAKLTPKDIDILFSGDLMDQIISSTFAARTLKSPYIGIFGACSTMAESLVLGAAFIDGNNARTVACATSSHFSSAEKQFRYPLELGTQRPPTTQWTVTGAGCTVMGKGNSGIYAEYGTIGEVTDWEVNDVNNMGGAMAPAAMNTLLAHFRDTGRNPNDYDLILTGDLGKLGSEILIDLMEYQGYHLGSNYSDCGQMIYNNSQKTFMGGSGCGCGASILNSYAFDRMERGELKNVLFVATGALMSTLSSQQGETIPGIAHAIAFKMEDKK